MEDPLYIIRVHKNTKSTSGTYAIRDKWGEDYAMNTLSCSALALYLKISQFPSGQIVIISSKSIREEDGEDVPLPRRMDIVSVGAAVVELQQAGFLKKSKDGKSWAFFDKSDLKADFS